MGLCTQMCKKTNIVLFSDGNFPETSILRFTSPLPGRLRPSIPWFRSLTPIQLYCINSRIAPSPLGSLFPCTVEKIWTLERLLHAQNVTTLQTRCSRITIRVEGNLIALVFSIKGGGSNPRGGDYSLSCETPPFCTLLFSAVRGNTCSTVDHLPGWRRRPVDESPLLKTRQRKPNATSNSSTTKKKTVNESLGNVSENRVLELITLRYRRNFYLLMNLSRCVSKDFLFSMNLSRCGISLFYE